MSLHLPSFLLGLAALPAIVLVALALVRAVESLTSGRRGPEGRRPAGPSLDPLRFTPRLISELRRPLEADEDHARAS